MKIETVHPGASWSTADVHDGLVPALQAQGHEIWRYDLDQRIALADRFLKLAWRRSDHSRPKPNWADAIYLAGQGVLERALRQDVDWVLIISAMFLHPDWLILLRRAGLRTAILFTESPYDDQQQGNVAQYAEVCWTNERTSVPYLSLYSPNVYYLPHAYHPVRHYPGMVDGENIPTHDVVFVGTGFPERAELLSAVNWDGIDLGLYGNWSGLGSRSKLRQYVRGKVIDNAKAAALYRRATIGLNLHRTSMDWSRHSRKIEYAESLNPRAYELAACGVFTVSDHRAEVGEVFGRLVPTFETPAELERTIRYYLAHDDERQAMAAQLPRAVAGHTFAVRALQITADLEQAMEGAQRVTRDAVIA